MKAKFAMAIGIVTGTATYQLIRSGISEADWAQVGFVAIFALAVLLLVPRARVATSGNR